MQADKPQPSENAGKSNSLTYDVDTNSFVGSLTSDPEFFLTLCLKVTGACAASCDFCCEPDRRLASVPAREWESLIVEAVANGTQRFSLSGGEPLLYGELRELLTLIKKHGAATFLATADGTRLKRLAPRLRGLLDAVRVSVLGGPAVHDKTIGRDRALSELEAGVTACRVQGIPVWASTVATQAILPDLPLILRWVNSFSIPKLYIFELLDSGLGQAAKARGDAVSSKHLHEQLEALAEEAARLHIDIRIVPNNLTAQAVICYADGRVILDPVVTPNGQALLGNWKDQGIGALWNQYKSNRDYVRSLSKRLHIY